MVTSYFDFQYNHIIILENPSVRVFNAGLLDIKEYFYSVVLLHLPTVEVKLRIHSTVHQSATLADKANSVQIKSTHIFREYLVQQTE